VKKLSLSFIVVLLLLGTGNAFAQCPSITGPFFQGTHSWDVYSLDESCYTKTIGVSSTTVGCYYGSGWTFTDNWPMNSHTEFTIGANDPVILNNWNAGSFIEFNSPSNSAYDWIGIAVYVYHPNNTVSSYSIFYWDGTMGTLSGCAEQYGSFSATNGDTVKVQINASNGTTAATIKASIPRVITSN
jgi:hypothetical protein